MIIKAEELKIAYEEEHDGMVRPVYFIDAIPISFIKTRITKLKRERNKYEIGTQPFRFLDVKIYYYEMLMEEWKERTDA